MRKKILNSKNRELTVRFENLFIITHCYASLFQQEFPNFQVDVYATVLDNGGSALAAAIMAASLALANAGVPMFGLVTASTVVSRLSHVNFNKFMITYN